MIFICEKWQHFRRVSTASFTNLLIKTIVNLFHDVIFEVPFSQKPSILVNILMFPLLFSSSTEVANGFSCPAAGEIANAGSFSRHAHPDDCRKYYICLEGTAREYGCPIGTVFKIGDSEGTGNCESPEDVPGW